MSLEFKWTLTVDSHFESGFDQNQGFFISAGGLKIPTAVLTITNPTIETPQNLRFGFIQNVTSSSITWYYHEENAKVEKKILAHLLDQAPGRADFFYTEPTKLNSYLSRTTYITFPVFQDYPRTYGTDEDFFRLEGKIDFSLFAVIYNTATKGMTTVAQCTWGITYDAYRNSNGAITAGASSASKIIQSSIIDNHYTRPPTPASQMKLNGPLPNDSVAQDIKFYSKVNGAWQLETDIPSASDNASNNESSDDDIEMVSHEPGKLSPPPGLAKYYK